MNNRLKKCKFNTWKLLLAVSLLACVMLACAGCKNDGSQESLSSHANSRKQDINENDGKKEQDMNETVTAEKKQGTDETLAAEKKQETDEPATAEKGQETDETITEDKEQNTSRAITSAGGQATNENTAITQPQQTLEVSAVEKETAVPTDAQDKNNRIVAIDAGHQSRGNSEKEPVGPGAAAMKAKVAGGTRGVATGKPEYELTLEISIKLKQELEGRGYTVVMIRETNDVNISNAERAEIANKSGATAFIRIHADGSENSSVSGATTLCPTAQNPYCSAIYNDSRRLSEAVLNNLCQNTGCKKRYVSEVDNMSGINWCQIPVSIVEVGFMTNAGEDMLLSTEEYQWKVAEGIADGVDEFYNRQ